MVGLGRVFYLCIVEEMKNEWKVDAEMKSPGEAKRFHGGFISGNKQKASPPKFQATRFIKGDARAFGLLRFSTAE